MYTVMVVDDEPAARNHLCGIIERRCRDFCILDTAEHGVQALEKMEKRQPDLLLTDVKMPMMDGIVLVKKVRELYPQIMSIVISGYQEFEYVKGAIQSGVCDYILKPVIPSKLAEVMAEMAERLGAFYYRKRYQLLKKLSLGGQILEEELHRCFPEEWYYGALVRKNGLPRRFSAAGEIDIFSIEEERMLIYGRDEMEALYLCPKSLLGEHDFEKVIEDYKRKDWADAGYLTCVMAKEAFRISKLPKMAESFYRILDQRAVIGCSQTIFLEESAGRPAEKADVRALKAMEIYLENQQHALFVKEFDKSMRRWGKELHTQLWMEDMVRQIVYLIQKTGYKDFGGRDYEFILEDAFFYAQNMEELRESLEGILTEEGKSPIGRDAKADMEKFYGEAAAYMQEHLAEPLTIQSLCRQFGVSQTYLSKAFRKYGEASFSNYLTRLRIEEAKKIMREHEGIYIRDVAAMTGFSDQFYFSRIFRSLTGIRPSDYIGSVKQEAGCT